MVENKIVHGDKFDYYIDKIYKAEMLIIMFLLIIWFILRVTGVLPE